MEKELEGRRIKRTKKREVMAREKLRGKAQRKS